MYAQVYSPNTGSRLGRASLTAEVLPMLKRDGFKVGSHLGDPVVRSTRRRYAEQVRIEWNELWRLVANTGYGIKVELTSREAQALVRAGFINSSVQTWRLSIREGRVNVLAGHGRVS